MILRRITEHVKAQNWFAVGLDFIIVVVGVFIGIQVANWNDARQELIEEAEIRERVREDFVHIKQDADRSHAFHKRTFSDMKVLVRSLHSGVLEGSDVAAFKRALYFGSTFQTSADRSATTRELLSSGQSSLLRDKEFLDELVAYETFLDRHYRAQSYIFDTAAMVSLAFNGAYHLDLDKPFTSNEHYTDDNTLPVGDFDFAAMVTNDEFESAAEELLSLQSITLVWRDRIDDRIDTIMQHLEAQ